MLRLSRILCLLLLVPFLVSLGWSTDIVRAAGGDEPEDVARQTTITITYTRYEWWLLRWDTSQILCQVYIDHTGWPTADEILVDCGRDIYWQWVTISRAWLRTGADLLMIG